MPATATITEAREFALEKHAGQVRQHDGKPYVAHLDGVAAMLKEHGYGARDFMAVAYLHDTLEKSDTSIDELIRGFGADVAEFVYWLTDREKGRGDIAALQSAWRMSRAPWEAKVVKLADIIDNGDAIIRHDPAFGPTFFEEKRLQLRKMAEVEGSKLLRLPLFQKAVTVTEAAMS